MENYLIVGRVEKIHLTNLGIRVRAKIDTGAKTSALSVKIIQRFVKDKLPMVSFTVSHRRVKSKNRRVKSKRRISTIPIVTLPVIDERYVKNSGGEKELRPVIETSILIGNKEWTIQITLTDRSLMQYPMLIGREALAGNCIVDPNRAYVHQQLNNKV